MTNWAVEAEFLGLFDDDSALSGVVDDEDDSRVGLFDLEDFGTEVFAAFFEGLLDEDGFPSVFERFDEDVFDAVTVVVVDVHDGGFVNAEVVGDVDPFEALSVVGDHHGEEEIAALFEAGVRGDLGDLNDAGFLRFRADGEALGA